jgi:hypothetical protein
MNNYDESRNGADLGGGALPSDKSAPGYDGAAPPQPTAPNRRAAPRRRTRVRYYEPWQQPVYRQASGQEPYSPESTADRLHEPSEAPGH